MSEAARQAEELPPSISENIETIADSYARHEERLSLSQAIIEKVSKVLGSPAYVAGNLLFVILWICGNLAAGDLGWPVVDAPPFFWLQGLISLNAFVISTTVLIRQNRLGMLATHHAHLDLQVNLLTEEKCSKIIGMLEALRHDLPGAGHEPDPQAEEMAKSADTKAVLNAIEHGNT